jgi:hypothetical protein
MVVVLSAAFLKEARAATNSLYYGTVQVCGYGLNSAPDGVAQRSPPEYSYR